MIEAEELPTKKSLENLKDDAVFLLNDEEKIKNDQKIDKNKVDGKYETFSLNLRNVAVSSKKLLIGTLKSFQ